MVVKSDIIQSHENGGFQIICLDTLSKSLKITLVCRFYDNACISGWKHFVIDTLPDVLHITDLGYV